MKKKNDVIKRYIEGIIGCIVLVVGVFLCLSENIFIQMLPIAFIIGIVGLFVFEKKAMTSCFFFLISLVLLQIKAPSQLLYNVITAMQLGIGALLGEVSCIYAKDFIKLLKQKKNKGKNKEKIKALGITLVSLLIAVEINALTNGNYINYFRARNKLKDYFVEEYSSGSRFKIVSSKYVFSNSSRYVFYTQDTLNNSENGKFQVHLNDDKIEDDYKEQILNSVSNDITEKTINIEKGDMDVKVAYSDMNVLTISLYKQVDKIETAKVEEYAKQIATYLDEALKVEEFSQIEQIKIVLESKEDSKQNLASYIYMDGYKTMLTQKQEEPYVYIMKALNIEYLN